MRHSTSLASTTQSMDCNCVYAHTMIVFFHDQGHIWTMLQSYLDPIGKTVSEVCGRLDKVLCVADHVEGVFGGVQLVMRNQQYITHQIRKGAQK